MLAILSSGCAVKKRLHTNLKTDSTYHQVTLRKDTLTLHDSTHTTHSLTQTVYDSTTLLTYTFARPVTWQEIQQQTAPIATLTTTHHIQKQHAAQQHHQTRLTHAQQHHYDSTQQTSHNQTRLITSSQLQRAPSYNWMIYTIGSLILVAILITTLRKYLF